MRIQAEETAERWAPPWWAVFVVGLLLWVATIAVGRITRNVILLPTIVLLGSFLVPITAVVWFDSFTSVWGVVVVSLIGLIPFIWLWRRGDGGGVLTRRRPV